ncbi:chemical-damaging agent resistance protein C [Clostridia bacterium]|nr:chemical-damaging agent resistance protein C [Clostridia bacterium]
MPINLQKGQKIDLTKTNPGLKKLIVGLGWDTNRYDGSEEFDLDVSVFLLGESGKVSSQEDFVFYGNLEHKSKSVKHQGDNRTGTGAGDDEVIEVDLSLVPTQISRIAFAVTIYEAEKRRQNFGQISNAYIRILNAEQGEELLHYDLGEDFSIETSVVVGELYQQGNEWKFNAIGSGFSGGLAALCANYGVDAA